MKDPKYKKSACNCKLASKFFDADAQKVYLRLAKSSKETYFVGGCVRDILLGQTPKDFDLVTSARPNQIRRLFKNSRIVGKRFRLVHVLFEDKIVEVATFRGSPSHSEDPNNISLLKRDNVFGTLEEDVWRRDFTINGLYYDYLNSRIIDYVGGIEDLHLRKIRVIGDPDIRFREDPVRILRAVKLAIRLNFSIEPQDSESVKRHTHLLSQVPSPRILLEITKILQEGSCYPCFTTMDETKIFEAIAPDFSSMWNQKDTFAHEIFLEFLNSLDQIPWEKRCHFSEAVLLSSICFPLIVSPHYFSEGKKKKKMSLSRSKLMKVATRLSIPRRTLEKIQKILATQVYLEMGEDFPVHKRKKLVNKDYFFDALDLLEIRTYQTPSSHIYEFWNDYIDKYDFYPI